MEIDVAEHTSEWQVRQAEDAVAGWHAPNRFPLTPEVRYTSSTRRAPVETVSGRANPRRGQAAVFLTLSLPVLFGLLGMVVDFGWAYWRKEAAKTAAQAAASAVVAAAGASIPASQSDTACPASLDTNKPWQVGCDFAIKNGFTNGASHRTVSIQIGSGATGIPVSGVSPSKYWVSATVTETIPTLFSAVLGNPAEKVLARSTAAVYNSSASGCVYVLDPSAHRAFNMNGANFGTGCGIYVNSSQSDAAYEIGGNITMNGSAKVNIHGGLSWGGGTICGNAPPTVPNCVQQNQPSVTNPFSGMTAPTPAGSCTADPNINGGNSNTINSGTYCAITVSGGNNIQFNSGIYIIKTGNLTISGGNFSPTATNVMFYIPPTNANGQINITGGNMQWNGISGNGADGFVFWVANSHAQNITGGNYTINGVTYMPNSLLTYAGGNGTQQTLVTNTLTVNGGNINAPASSSAFTGGGGVGGAYVVE